MTDDQGRPNRTGEALLAVLAGKGAVQRRADDRGMLELGGILSKLLGIESAPFRFAEINEQWSACFTVES